MKIELPYLLASGFKPRFHPNGFIQLNLNASGTTRLHVWPEADSGLKKQESDNTIHDHIFEMQSRILAGKLTNVAYEFIPVGSYDEEQIYEVYQASYPTPKENSFLSKTNDRGILREIDRVTMTPGSEYRFRAFQFHDSIATELTATVMHKAHVYEMCAPRVLCKLGETPDCAFSRFQNPEELMWNQIRKVMCGKIGWFEVPDAYLEP